ncbi:hypothetical protein SLS60_006439 [Paraconiothyrium brasiliense]|uniref:Uncharacterized protein n=1 Tax=Paraconiothyrium brasiliense TaxID=300254 RepID=A0ABR3RAQ6_9PLEO
MALLTSKNQAGRNWNTTSKSKVIASQGKSQETSDKHTSSTWDWSAEWEAPAGEESFKLNAPYDPTPITKLNLIDQYLEDNGFFDIKLGQPEDYLDLNDIHPIFRFDNFDTTLLGKYRARKAWKAMRPALALATKFLTSPDAKRDFWHLLFFGELKTDEATGKRYLVHSTKEYDTSSTSGYFENCLLEMSECINFFWTPLNARHNGKRYNGIFYPDLGSALGMVDRSVLDVIAERDNDATQDYLHSWHGHIGLSSVYLYHLLSLKSPARPGNWNSANMRLQLSLATLICHELSHAIWSKRGIEGPEPYVFLTDQKPELGFNFEVFLAGVVVELSLVCSVIGRMESLRWDNTFAMPGIRAVVDMKWVESWFRKDTWTGRVTFSTAPSTTGNRRPRLCIADRWFKNNILAPAVFQPVLYIDGKAVAPHVLGRRVSHWKASPCTSGSMQ